MQLIFKVLIKLLFALGLSQAQPSGFSVGQVWNLYFTDGNGWQISLDASGPDGLTGTATSASFGSALEVTVDTLDANDQAFLGLPSGNYVGFLLTYPTGIVTANGGDLLLCSLPADDLSQGKTTEFRQESTGLRALTGGNTCSASLMGASAEAASSWPPTLTVGETWRLSVSQGGAEIAAWTVSLNANSGETMTGTAVGFDSRTAEVEYLGQSAPAPSLVDNWVFALSGAGTEPMYCVFSREKPFSETSMTGSVLYAGATCTAEKQ